MANEENRRSLNVSFGLNASEFSKGVAELKQELSNLNAKFIENKQKVSDTSKELKELHKQEEKLKAEIDKSGKATEGQKRQMEELSEKIAQTTSKMGQLKAEEADIKSGIKAATKELQNQKAELDNNAKSTGLLHNALNKLGTAAKAFIGIYGAKKLWEMLIGSNEEMEQYQTSFEVMLGSAEKAKKMIADIQSFAAKTPLTKSQSVEIGTLLMNYGVEDGQLLDTMQKLGDLAGGNAEKMNRIALAYGQMLAKGKVTGEELRQMTEAGVPLQNALAESIGVTGEEFSKMVSKGQVGIKELDKAIEELTTGNGKFAGMMEKQSQTMKGMFSTLQDEVSEFFRQMGEGAFGEVKDALSDLMEQLKEWEQDGTLERWADKLGTTVEVLIKLLRGAIEIVFEFGDVIVAVLAGKAVYSAADKLIKKVGEIKDKLSELGVKGAAGKVKAGFGEIVSSINPAALALSALTVAASAVALKMSELNSINEEYSRSIENIENASRNTIAEAQAEISMLENKTGRYDELRTAAELTAEQHAELKNIAQELQETFGDEIKVINETTGAYNDLSDALENYTARKQARAKNQAVYNRLEEYYRQESEIQQKLDELHKNWTPEDYIAAGSYSTTKGILGGFNAYSAAVIDLFGGKSSALGNVNATAGELYESRALTEQLGEVQNNIQSLETECGNLDKALYETSKSTDNTAKSTENLTEVYDAHKEAVENLAKSLSTVSSAYSEQAESGKLSYNTVMSLIDAGYASCLQIDEETGAVRLNAEAYKELAKAKISARMADLQADIASQTSEYDKKYQALNKVKSLWAKNQLRDFLDDQASTVASGSKAELAALQELYNNLDSYIAMDGSTTGKNGFATGKSDSGYSNAYNAYKTEADKKIDLIKEELAAKKELRDKTIEYLDEEIQKRKELNQDDDMQKEIDKIKAQLDYDQLDDFSRGQLEKQLQKAEEEWQEVLWQREMQKKKDQANAAYSAAADNAAKAQEQISNAVNTVKCIMDNLANGITNISNTINNNVNNTNTANINLASQYLTMAQITKAVKDALIGTVLIR